MKGGESSSTTSSLDCGQSSSISQSGVHRGAQGRGWEEVEEDTGTQYKELSSLESCKPRIGTEIGAS